MLNVTVDEIDADLLSDYNWCDNGAGYACGTNGKYIRQLLHRVIAERAGFDLSVHIDHEDGEPLNCRRNNLRTATQSQNIANSKLKTTNKSGYKGVSWDKLRSKWRAQITVNYKSMYLGLFDDKEDAARAYDEAALKHFGEFARLNFPNRKRDSDAQGKTNTVIRHSQNSQNASNSFPIVKLYLGVNISQPVFFQIM